MPGNPGPPSIRACKAGIAKAPSARIRLLPGEIIQRRPERRDLESATFIRRVIGKGGQAAFILYGCDHHGHHRPNFDIQDEQSLPAAFAIRKARQRRLTFG